MKEVTQWFCEQGWRPQAFQKECWKAYDQGKNGMLHSPTGSGKTYALWGGIVQEAFNQRNILMEFRLFGLHPCVLWQ